jgi:hypothetical protein
MFNNIFLSTIIFHKNFIILSLTKNIFYFHITYFKKTSQYKNCKKNKEK